MQRMRMYWALYRKELRIIAGPASVIIGMTLLWVLMYQFHHGVLTYYSNFVRHARISKIIYELNHLQLWYYIQIYSQFIPMILHHIIAVILGYSLLFEQVTPSRIQMKALPVGRSVAPAMKVLTVMSVCVPVALLITSIYYGRMTDNNIYRNLYLMVRAELDMSLANFLLTYSVLLAPHTLDFVRSYCRGGFSQATIMFYYCGLVMVAYGVDTILRRFRVLTWIVMILAANGLFIFVVSHVTGPQSGMFSHSTTRAYNALFGLLYTGIGLFLTRYAREA
jgi:hypothetical protein